MFTPSGRVEAGLSGHRLRLSFRQLRRCPKQHASRSARHPQPPAGRSLAPPTQPGAPHVPLRRADHLAAAACALAAAAACFFLGALPSARHLLRGPGCCENAFSLRCRRCLLARPGTANKHQACNHVVPGALLRTVAQPGIRPAGALQNARRVFLCADESAYADRGRAPPLPIPAAPGRLPVPPRRCAPPARLRVCACTRQNAFTTHAAASTEAPLGRFRGLTRAGNVHASACNGRW
eukprot:352835-Chlamydomonas_euryale.AAC.5